MLWDFGFRHHKDKQVKWIEGGAGTIGMATIVDHEPADFMTTYGERFLAETDPKMLERIRTASPDEQKKLRRELLKNLQKIKEFAEALGFDLDEQDD